MAQQQAQVDEVIGIMHKNVENVLERDRKLGDLEERADALQDGCAQFEKQVTLISSNLCHKWTIKRGFTFALLLTSYIQYFGFKTE